MGMAPPPRVLPEGVPADAEPVTEEQIQRLPEYAQYLIEQSMELAKSGILARTTTREELERLRAAFFAATPFASIAAEPAQREIGEMTPASNSTACEDDADVESMRIE